MVLSPTRSDIWLATLLAHCLGRHPLFDFTVQNGIRLNLLGGFWYAAALFVVWVQGRHPGKEPMRRRVLTTLLGSLIAIQLTVLAATVIAWPPPAHNPSLALLYSQYVGPDSNTNSFPSQSTALYAAVAAGVYSLHRFAGWLLCAGLLLLVAFPRMYEGGHYASDVLAGLGLGLTGYAGARYLFEPTLVRYLDRAFQAGAWLQVVAEVGVFAWILEVAVEFRDVAWIRDCVKYLLETRGSTTALMWCTLKS